MIVAVSVGEDLLRALLQGGPPGAVYALVALGFVLAYKTSGVFNLAFGAQAYVSAALYFHARQDWEWGMPAAFVLSVLVVAPALGLLLERLVFRHLRTASWLFPLYLFLLNLFVLPIAIGGLHFLPAGSNPDMFVLTLPMWAERPEVALLAFLGGFLAATSMVIVAAIALSTMVSNHIIMPVALRVPLRIGGTFKDPSFRPEAGPLIARTAAAAALYTLAPPAALLALIETGPGESIDCGPAVARGS